jgi:hypothetical protein
MESCEDCGATEEVRAFGIDQTPLCPDCFAIAEMNYEAAVRRRQAIEDARLDIAAGKGALGDILYFEREHNR